RGGAPHAVRRCQPTPGRGVPVEGRGDVRSHRQRQSRRTRLGRRPSTLPRRAPHGRRAAVPRLSRLRARPSRLREAARRDCEAEAREGSAVAWVQLKYLWDRNSPTWKPPMPSSPREFVLNPAAYGLPTRDDLVKLRIWDMHYHGFLRGGIPAHEENLFYVERMG